MIEFQERAMPSLLRVFVVVCELALTAGAQAQTTPAPAAASTPAPAASAPLPAAPAVPLPPPMTAPDYRMGNPKAKVTVIEYASDTCPHCAKFALEVFPAFKKKYIDTGKVLFVFREYPTDQLSAAGFVVARCAGPAKFFDVVSAFYPAQRTAKTGLEFLMAGAKVGGLSEDQVKACLSDPVAVKAFLDRVKAFADADKIDSTPTFLINGVKQDNTKETTLATWDAALQPLLAAKPVQKRRKG